MTEARRALLELASRDVLVVGIGNPQRGDDAAGLILGRAVAERLGKPYLECEEVPENYLADMHQSPAGTVLFVDAVHMSAEAGEIRVLDLDELADPGVSTHKSSLRLLAGLLTEHYGKRVALLGIQPICLDWGKPLTEPVARAIDRFVASLCGGSSE